ncbi:MAG: PhoH family protein [Myxococcota bacterium]|nr:PhoH family protein [Myxococcota bacterium]MDW8361529.1 PhoH family protein [Myxococcales bacterium]
MHKIYVLDTNVLLHDPRAFDKFEDNDVVVPIHVIEEIDQFKKESSELGRNARHVARQLDELRDRAGGSLRTGVRLDGGGLLRVAVPDDPRRLRRLDHAAMDHAILQTALEIRDRHRDTPVVFVTMDSNLRIRADALGLRAENYENPSIPLDELYSGIVEMDVPGEIVDRVARREEVPLEELGVPVPFPNACLVLRDAEQPRRTALGRAERRRGLVQPLRGGREGAWGVRPRNLEQHFALDLLLDPAVRLVTLVGKAGTGKTLLALAAALRCVVDEGTHARLLVSRPIFPLGRDVGYLPGTIEEKLNPWMRPIFDNLEYIFTVGRARGAQGRSYQELVAAGIIEVEPLTYIRGRSLPNQYLVVDEAQNLTPHEVKTIITRCGSETKIVLTGDPYQIDNPYVDAARNGLTTVAERFKQEPLAGHVTLTKGERSELAERATELL